MFDGRSANVSIGEFKDQAPKCEKITKFLDDAISVVHSQMKTVRSDLTDPNARAYSSLLESRYHALCGESAPEMRDIGFFASPGPGEVHRRSVSKTYAYCTFELFDVRGPSRTLPLLLSVVLTLFKPRR
jgi:hypothetical protein